MFVSLCGCVCGMFLSLCECVCVVHSEDVHVCVSVLAYVVSLFVCL